MTTLVEKVQMDDTHTPYVTAAGGALRSAGLWDDDAEMLLGYTGLGFHLVVDPGTCPSSPTSYDWTHVHSSAMDRIGVSSTCIECVGDDQRYPVARDDAIVAAKRSLDRGTPVVFKTFEYAEFGILTGYDDGDGVFHVQDITGSADPVLYANLGRPHGRPTLFVQTFDSRGSFEPERAAAEALRYAVDHWHGDAWPVPATYTYRLGAEGYGALIAAADGGKTDPLGLRYILRILADARRGIGVFMRRLCDDNVIRGIGGAAELFENVASLVKRAADLEPAEAPYERPLDAAVLPEVSAVLREAPEHEGRAIDEITKAIGAESAISR